jgi:enamine deaminase RidA (YjgF/YER057c/UK114 family)
MTDITRLHTSERASKIVVHGGVAYLSGQVAEDPQADIQDQTRSTLGRVDDLLIDAGSDREHLLSVTIYLRDIDNDFALMNEVWNAWVPSSSSKSASPQPSSTQSSSSRKVRPLALQSSSPKRPPPARLLPRPIDTLKY